MKINKQKLDDIIASQKNYLASYAGHAVENDLHEKILHEARITANILSLLHQCLEDEKITITPTITTDYPGGSVTIPHDTVSASTQPHNLKFEVR